VVETLRVTSHGWDRLAKELGHPMDEPGSGCLTEDLLLAYCLGTASTGERAHAEQHLRVCVSCAEEAETFAEALDYWEAHSERLEQLRASDVGALQEAAAEPQLATALRGMGRHKEQKR